MQRHREHGDIIDVKHFEPTQAPRCPRWTAMDTCKVSGFLPTNFLRVIGDTCKMFLVGPVLSQNKRCHVTQKPDSLRGHSDHAHAKGTGTTWQMKVRSANRCIALVLLTCIEKRCSPVQSFAVVWSSTVRPFVPVGQVISSSQQPAALVPPAVHA